MRSQLIGVDNGGGGGIGRGGGGVSSKAEPRQTFAAGLHSFPFAFQLPTDLPGSYEGQPVGQIR